MLFILRRLLVCVGVEDDVYIIFECSMHSMCMREELRDVSAHEDK